MPQNRAYITGVDGEFQNSVPLECADDEVALKKAKRLVRRHQVELWQYTRKIDSFDKPQRLFRA
jgi:hypothetical protein